MCLVDISNLLYGLGVDRESFVFLHQELVDDRDVGLDGVLEGGEEGIIKLLDVVFNRGLDGQSRHCYAVHLYHAEGKRKG